MSDESPAAILYDAQGNPVLVSSDGSYQLSVNDDTANDLLKQILAEIRLNNAMLREALETQIDLEDVG